MAVFQKEVITKDYTRQQSYHGFPVLDLTRPPSVSQLPASSQDASPGPRYQEALGGERTRDRWAFASAESRPSPVSSAARPALPGCECLPRRPCRSPPQSKTSPVSVSNDGIEPVSPAGANSEPDMQGAASYPSEQAEQG